MDDRKEIKYNLFSLFSNLIEFNDIKRYNQLMIMIMETMKMNRFFSDMIKNIEPYVPGEQPKDKKYIKLNTNESPYPPSPQVLEAISEAVNSDLRLYPDPDCEDLKIAAAEYYGLKKEQIFVGNGSDEILAFCFGAFYSGKKVLFPDVSYSFYPVYANLFNVNYEEVPVTDSFEINAVDYRKKNNGIIIPNPNAPTSIFLDTEEIEKIIEQNKDSVVVIDEAYIDFGGISAVKYIEKYTNLLVIHTMSKSRSLAGLRVGFALGNETLIDGLERMKNSFNSYTIDRLAQAGAIAALKDTKYFEDTRNKVILTRDNTVAELIKLEFKVMDSKSNFIFISHKSFKALDLFQKLKENGILVRYFNKPRVDNYLRVSIGTDEEMGYLIDILKGILY